MHALLPYYKKYWGGYQFNTVCFNLIGTECAIPYNYNDMTLMWILHFFPFISDDLI